MTIVGGMLNYDILLFPLELDENIKVLVDP